MFAVALLVHLLAAIIWIGGMFFALLCLRPSIAEVLEPPLAGKLLAASLKRFFSWVWAAVAALLISGFTMVFERYDLSASPLWLYIMIALGLLMMMLFGHLYFAPFRRLTGALESGAKEVVPQAIGSIRKIVTINLALGLILVTVVSLGRYL